MEEKLMYLLYLATQQHVSDIHFSMQNSEIKISFRTLQGMKKMKEDIFDLNFFNYLKYISDLDLANTLKPQSGQFQREIDGNTLYFRFSLMIVAGLQTAVLRILNSYAFLQFKDLTYQKECIESFERWSRYPNGFIVLCGPTGSGKTTTLHALLHTIAAKQNRNIISLEDPIEIYDSSYLQLQINEKAGFTYEEGIKQVLRHDPDVIMIGEIRDTITAKMAYRCALTGHVVFSCVHAKNTFEAIKRLEELGLAREDMKGTLIAVSAQRLLNIKGKKERTCIYEILENKQLQQYLEDGKKPFDHKTIFQQIRKGVEDNYLDAREAQAFLKMEEL